jgi:succinyl-CoA synthetase alpha subunit
VHEKIRHLQDAGVTMVNHPEKFGGVMTELLSRGYNVQQAVRHRHTQRRTLHTSTRQHSSLASRHKNTSTFVQKRTFFISDRGGLKICHETQPPVQQVAADERMKLTIAFNRTSRTPVILVQQQPNGEVYSFQLDYRDPRSVKNQKSITEAAQQISRHPSVAADIEKLILRMYEEVYIKDEALMLEMTIAEGPEGWTITDTNFAFDDATKRAESQQTRLESFREVDKEDPAALQAQKNGIVYVRLEGDGNIGTLV